MENDRTKTTSALLLSVILLAACSRHDPPSQPEARGTPSASVTPTTGGGSQPPGNPPPPNILLIVTDDQRGGLQVMPQTRAVFARGGVRFDNTYVTTPLCCPSRVTILTGQYAHNHTIRRNQDGGRAGELRMVQHRLRKRGYRTAFFGKFLNYWDLEDDPPGFDRWATTSNDTYYDGIWNVDGKMRTVPTYSTTYIRQRAIRYLRSVESSDDRPWFMVLSTPAPHGPQTPEDRYVGHPVPGWDGNPATRDSDLSDKPDYVRDRPESFGEAAGVREAQLRTLLSVDDLTAETFKVMRELDESRETLAIFISDNGMLWGEFGMTGKTHAYTPSIKVPMMMRWPGHLEVGKTDGRMVANVDIVPTILDAVDLPMQGVDGRSLLRGARRDRLLLEHWPSSSFSTPRWNSLRTARFQYVEYYGRDREVRFREYFDLERDPWQLDNLLEDGRTDNDPNVTRLARELRRLSRCRGASCP